MTTRTRATGTPWRRRQRARTPAPWCHARSEHHKHATRRVEVPGEVVGVGPGKDTAGGAGARREAEEPP